MRLEKSSLSETKPQKRPAAPNGAGSEWLSLVHYLPPPSPPVMTKRSVLYIPYTPVAPKTHSIYPVDGEGQHPQKGKPCASSRCCRRNLTFLRGLTDTMAFPARRRRGREFSVGGR